MGRVRQNFVKEVRQFANCPADIVYWAHDPKAHQLAKDIKSAMDEAGWNITFAPELRRLEGIRIVTRSHQLHAEEISSVVGFLRAAGFETKVRVRPELETESVQIAIGAVPRAPQRRVS